MTPLTDTLRGRLTVPTARLVRTADGGRALLMEVVSAEPVTLDVRLRSGEATLERLRVRRARGVHWVRVRVDAADPGERVILTVRATGAAGDRTVVVRTLRIPPGSSEPVQLRSRGLNCGSSGIGVEPPCCGPQTGGSGRSACSPDTRNCASRAAGDANGWW